MVKFFIFLIKGISFFISLWPRKLQLFVGQVLGLLWFYGLRLRRGQVLENLRLAFPEWTESKRKQIARQNFEHYGRSFIEFLLLPTMDERGFNRLFVFEGIENYHQAFMKYKGVLMLTLHIGNWELMSATSFFLKIPLHVITKEFKAKGLNRIWSDLRLNRGIKLIRHEKSTFEILRAIRGGEVVGFILDQFTGPPIGVRTKFFGHETGTQAALALFADRTRAPVVPVYNIRQPDGRLKIVFEPEVPFMERGSRAENISLMTQAYTTKIEDIVKKYPEQWLWLHRRWKPFRE